MTIDTMSLSDAHFDPAQTRMIINALSLSEDYSSGDMLSRLLKRLRYASLKRGFVTVSAASAIAGLAIVSIRQSWRGGVVLLGYLSFLLIVEMFTRRYIKVGGERFPRGSSPKMLRLTVRQGENTVEFDLVRQAPWLYIGTVAVGITDQAIYLAVDDKSGFRIPVDVAELLTKGTLRLSATSSLDV